MARPAPARPRRLRPHRTWRFTTWRRWRRCRALDARAAPEHTPANVWVERGCDEATPCAPCGFAGPRGWTRNRSDHGPCRSRCCCRLRWAWRPRRDDERRPPRRACLQRLVRDITGPRHPSTVSYLLLLRTRQSVVVSLLLLRQALVPASLLLQLLPASLLLQLGIRTRGGVCGAAGIRGAPAAPLWSADGRKHL